jgi:uncharacterized protein (DUF362 family)/Pyruvate/2-oxoacid:ferredoxin oxidoreductase delta subunit
MGYTRHRVNTQKRPRIIIRQAAYDYGTLKPLIFETADAFLHDKVRSGRHVVIKPNLLAPARPERAMVTHPLVIKALVEYALQKGAVVTVSDSQAMGRFDRVLNESGIREALKGLDVEFREFTESVEVDVGEPFKKIEIAKEAMEADLLINLPKLKTHTQMRMTLGVKNLFGCVVGLRKPEWHLRTGVNRELFATLLVKVHDAVSPALTVIDGILAMQGQGPGRSGTPRKLGFIAASTNTYALDVTLCRILGVEPYSVFTNKAAGDMGYIPEDIEIDGEAPETDDFTVPDVVPLVFGPERIHGFMRRHLLQRPLSDDSACRLCGECWKYCPAKAITRRGRRIHFDYEKCIRCYCCIEVCPEGALKAKEPLMGKVVRKLKK